HAQDADVALSQGRKNQVFEAIEMGIHYIERHLHGVKCEAVATCGPQHVKMNLRTLVAGEADVSQLAGFFRVERRFDSASASENSIRVIHPDHLVKLHQVDSIGLQPPQRVVDLFCGRGFVAAIDFRHQKCLVAIAIAQRLSNPNLALAVVVVPTVVEEIGPTIQRSPHDPDAFGFLHQRAAEVMASDTHDGDTLAGLS
ncbi:MAG: hypothetical protein WAN81_02180, partial [Candidatus Binataceae bacterium]